MTIETKPQIDAKLFQIRCEAASGLNGLWTVVASDASKALIAVQRRLLSYIAHGLLEKLPANDELTCAEQPCLDELKRKDCGMRTEKVTLPGRTFNHTF